MVDSPNLGLPLLQPAQAQKHVTVNEALMRLDALSQLVLKSVDITIPPALASDGESYGVPSGATGVWTGHEGEVAIYSNGGWVYVSPKRGWRGWIDDSSSAAVFDGVSWNADVVAISQNGAIFTQRVIELDHTIAAGSTSTIIGALPGGTIVYGVTGRVKTALSGALTGWRLGVSGSGNRYGSGLGVNVGSWIRGLTYSPLTYYSATDLVLTAEGADFVDGEVRLAIHLVSLGLPTI